MVVFKSNDIVDVLAYPGADPDDISNWLEARFVRYDDSGGYVVQMPDQRKTERTVGSEDVRVYRKRNVNVSIPSE